MTSERQKVANQANARYSTGPKSPEGKAVVRFNARRHGLLARDVVLPEEDARAFEELSNEVRAHLSPAGPIEKFLVDRVVNDMWRLERVARAERALFESRIHGLRADRFAKQVASYQRSILDLASIGTNITDKGSHAKAKEALGRAESERDRDEVLLGRAIDADAKEADAFTKLARYERSRERSLYRALGELRHEQDKRRNCASSPISDAITLDTEDTE